jgi:pyridoxine 5-phosphate synthase
MTRLGVNVDHVATVREARKTNEPDPVWAAVQAELGGADGITVHLRGDRRHIQDRDVSLLGQIVQTGINLEMAVTETMISLAQNYGVNQVTLVPEKREEITTRGGLDIEANQEAIGSAIKILRDANIRVSLFVDPTPRMIELTFFNDTATTEIYTGIYAEARDEAEQTARLEDVRTAAELSARLGLSTYAGHGLTYRNVQPIAAIPQIEELNIGHSIIARSLFVGVEIAVREMVNLISDL